MSPVARSNKLLFCAASSIGRQLAQFIKSQNKANCARSSIGFRGLHTLKSPTLVERSDPSLAGLVSASMDLGELICKQTDLTLEMTKRVMVEEAKESNLVYSPLSMNVVLSLIAAGSSGRTLDQLVSFLGSKSNKDLNSFASQVVSLVLADGSASGGPRLSFANSVWIDKSLPIKPSFSEVVQNVYKATAKQVDFQTKFNDIFNTIFSSPPTVALLVGALLDNTLEAKHTGNDRGLPWWVPFQRRKGDVRNDEFYRFPLRIHDFLPSRFL